MGTKHLTVVCIDNDYKVAQYGALDGGPRYQGLKVLHFLRDKINENKFKEALRNSVYIDVAEFSSLLNSYMKSGQGLDGLERDYPQFSGDTGADILELIQNHPEGMKLQNSITFAANSCDCIWAWIVDLDKGMFEAYTGFNKTQPLTSSDRFYFLKEHEKPGYYGVVLSANWALNNLPTDIDFLQAFNLDED